MGLQWNGKQDAIGMWLLLFGLPLLLVAAVFILCYPYILILILPAYIWRRRRRKKRNKADSVQKPIGLEQ
jgi:uncharacterized iron-regulated membrane protein